MISEPPFFMPDYDGEGEEQKNEPGKRHESFI